MKRGKEVSLWYRVTGALAALGSIAAMCGPDQPNAGQAPDSQVGTGDTGARVAEVTPNPTEEALLTEKIMGYEIRVQGGEVFHIDGVESYSPEVAIVDPSLEYKSIVAARFSLDKEGARTPTIYEVAYIPNDVNKSPVSDYIGFVEAGRTAEGNVQMVGYQMEPVVEGKRFEVLGAIASVVVDSNGNRVGDVELVLPSRNRVKVGLFGFVDKVVGMGAEVAEGAEPTATLVFPGVDGTPIEATKIIDTATPIPPTATLEPTATEEPAAGWGGAIEKQMGCWGDKGVNWYSEKEARWAFKVVSDGKLITEPVEIPISDAEKVTMLAGFRGYYCVREGEKPVVKNVVVPTLVEFPDGRLYRFRGGAIRDDSPLTKDEALEDVVGGVKGETMLVFVSPDMWATNAGFGIKKGEVVEPWLSKIRIAGLYWEYNGGRLESFFAEGDGEGVVVLPSAVSILDKVELP